MNDLREQLQEVLGSAYRIERELGGGGMSRVFVAEEVELERRVVVKVLPPDVGAGVNVDRFRREIQLAARLQHPHIVPLHAAGARGALLYYTMPFIADETLRARLVRSRELPVHEATKILSEIADALSYAHSQGVVHRDIKPENVLLSGHHALVTDFGVAKALARATGDNAASDASRLTSVGIAIGTPAYMAPEQAAADPMIDHRADIYSLGVLGYELLSGRTPFLGDSPQQMFFAHITAQPDPVTKHRPNVPPGLAALIMQCLEKNPADRYQTAEEVHAHLDAIATPVRRDARRGLATIPSFLPPPKAWLSRRSWYGALWIAAAVVVGATILILRQGRELLAPPVPTYERTAIAVLPFDNLNAEGPQAYFAGGLHDELQTQLSKVAALKVISRTSVMSYAGSTTPLRQIASELRVGSVVEASVQVIGERLRVNVALIDAATGAHLWADRYDRTLDDAFAIQSDVARQIVLAVGAALSAAERRGLATAPTTDTEAYLLYLQGREYYTRPGRPRQNVEIAQRLYERALARDPNFALARAALSEVHGRMHWYRWDPSPARVARQLEEAAAALRLAPDLPQAHVAMGLAHYWGRLDYRRALEEFGAALEGLPNDAEVWAWIGAVHRRMGSWDEVLGAFEKATELDPRDANLFYNLGGTTFVILHRYADAVRAFDKALSLAPDLHTAALWKGWTYVRWQGQLDTLRTILSRVPRDAELGLETGSAQLLRWERHGDGVLKFLERARVGVFDNVYFFQPSSLHAAWAHRLRGDGVAARAAFDSALVLVDSVLRELPDDRRLHAARGLALAGLGRRDEALGEARWLRRSLTYREDAFAGPMLAEDHARILAQAGESGAALDEIERLLARPSFLSVHALRLDPLWDPIRHHPRFTALLAKYRAR